MNIDIAEGQIHIFCEDIMMGMKSDMLMTSEG
jgi:hypothetical protein